MKKRARLILGLPFFAMLLPYSLAGFYAWLHPIGSNAGWDGTGQLGEFHITKIAPGSPAHELHPGDKIIAINGVRVYDHPEALGDEDRMPPGSNYSMTVERDGRELTFTWQTIPKKPNPFPWNRLTTLLFWLGGLLVLLLKPEDQQAWLLALMLGTFSTLLGGGPDDQPSKWLNWIVVLSRIAALFSFPLLFHLFLYFPQTSPWLRRWPRLATWLYLPFCLFVLPSFGVGRLPAQYSTPVFRWPPMHWLLDHVLVIAAFVSVLAYLLAALVCLWLNYRTADTSGRRRLRVVLWGSLIGFGSLFLVIAMESTHTRERFETFWGWLQYSTLFTLPLVPLSFAYAIVRHRVIPISLIIRRGVRYLLVSRGSILLAILFAGLIVSAMLALLFKYVQPSALTQGLVSAAVGIAAWQAARWLHRRYLAPLIDRQFFRQAYDARQIVAELSESLRTTTEIPRLLGSVANTLQTALQTEGVVMLLRDKDTGEYRSAYACEYSRTEGRAVESSIASHLPPGAASLTQLVQTGEPLELDGSNPAFNLASNNGSSRLTEEERVALREMKSALLLPLKTKDTMPGVVALGPRLGDLPFSGEDKQLLKSVGASASLALENAQLVEGMMREARRRQEIEAENEQRARELEGARQLQLSMLPRDMPQLPNLEVAATMRMATEVGGDYYDFHVGDDGSLTIAIGDATGHGLRAGTVVTATKGLFNHLAGQDDLVATLSQTSLALKQMNLRSLYMALTLVRLTGDHLQCSVAGMPPILVHRAATKTIEEIPLRGYPLGGLASYTYRQAELTLEPNDLVLLMSDGLAERFNFAGEMLGYDMIKEFVVSHAASPPQAILDDLLRASDEWADGKLADDDMTFVAFRRKPAGGDMRSDKS